ncbi:MAG: hypothetical protein M3R38_32535 [Actinomycetota bacterium]|nr:hypothetical protein [Actinomycetota bacterium]
MSALIVQKLAITWPQAMVAVVAALGFLLSLYNFWVARLEKRPKLVVTPGFSVVALPADAFHTFTVANHGRIDVFLSQLYLEVGTQRMFFPDLTAVFVKIDPLGGEAVGKDHW